MNHDVKWQVSKESYFTNIDRDDSLKPYIILLWQYNDSVEQI